jgi:hypothetical protein
MRSPSEIFMLFRPFGEIGDAQERGPSEGSFADLWIASIGEINLRKSAQSADKSPLRISQIASIN